MPRPTAAQLAYGSATVVFATLAMLLLSQTRNGIGVVIISVVALGLGLLVAVTVPAPRTVHPPSTDAMPLGTVPSAASVAEDRVPVQRVHAGAESRISEHTLRS